MKLSHKLLAIVTAASLLGACDNGLDYDIKSGTIVKKSSTPMYFDNKFAYNQGEFAIDINDDRTADCELVLSWPPDTVLFNYAQVGYKVTYQNILDEPRFLVSSGNPLVRNRIFTINGVSVAEIKREYSKQR